MTKADTLIENCGFKKHEETKTDEVFVNPYNARSYLKFRKGRKQVLLGDNRCLNSQLIKALYEKSKEFGWLDSV